LLDRATGEALLARLDAALNEVAEVRRQVVELMPPAAANGAGTDTDDFAEYLQIDAASAQSRFSIPQDTLRAWARSTQNTEQAVAIRRGGRWVFSICRLRKRCGLE
jgi:hypothetical protein